MRLLVTILVGLFGLHQVESTGKVLFYMPYTSKSVKITYMPLAEELAKRGHEVTVITPFKSPKEIKNLREIIVKSDIEKIGLMMSDQILRGKESNFSMLQQAGQLLETGIETNRDVLDHTEILELFASNAKFDVTINSVFVANEVGYYLAHRFNSTLILYFTIQCSFVDLDNVVGQPHNPALTDPMCNGFKHPMKFWQRVANTLLVEAQKRLRDYFVFPRLEEIINKKFPGESRPTLRELESNAGLVFQFGHPLLSDGLRPLSPNYIQVGMMNCKPPKPLPKNLQDFLDGAQDGAILVSFGSVLTGSKMSEANRQILMNVFSSLKQRIVFKWETEDMPNKPDNVLLSKWLPQQDILGHKNVKLFISHGGQSSCQESLCHQKPLLVISVFGDQPSNGEEASHQGYGIHIPYPQITVEKLQDAIEKLLNDPKYSNKAQQLGGLLVDEINHPLERATWWVEYAIRHPGITHLKSPSHDLSWYQLALLDVWAVLIGCFIALVGSVAMVFKCIFAVCCKSSKKQKKE